MFRISHRVRGNAEQKSVHITPCRGPIGCEAWVVWGLHRLVFVSRFEKMAVISDRDTFVPVLMPPYCHFRPILPRKRSFGGICATADASRFQKSPEISNRDTSKRVWWSFVAVCGGREEWEDGLQVAWWSIVVVSRVLFSLLCAPYVLLYVLLEFIWKVVEFRSSFLGCYMPKTDFRCI